jgi:hypothetical protein
MNHRLSRVLPLVAALAGSAAAFDAPLARPVSSYDLKAALDTQSHIIHGSETLTWLNDSPDSIPTLRFHLYMNAFKNAKSTFLRESGGQLRGVASGSKEWGWIDVQRMRIEGGEDLTRAIRYIHPDDGNQDDQTVIEVALSEPVEPGETLKLKIDFETKLPGVFARTGFHGSFYLAGQWFPKIGVWETAGFRYSQTGAWNCHQFHANSEFFSNFGNYTAEITLPSAYKIGATGELTGKRAGAAKHTTTWSYKQDGVIDFAWTAQPDYLQLTRNFVAARDVTSAERERARNHFAASDADLQLSDVKITLLLQPEHAGQAERHFRAAIAAIKGFGLRYGNYPYKTLTIVDPPYGAEGAGGMEYPTFITAGTSWNASDEVLDLEDTVVHEFGHQFWMQMVATNEFEESWLDEGFTTYSASRVVDEYYGPSALPLQLFGMQMATLFGVPKFGGDSANRSGYLLLPDADPILRNAWSYATTMSYVISSYPKSALFLRTLERLLGEREMARVMRAYQQRFRFHHPDTNDFLKVVNEVSGRDCTPLFDQFVFHARRLDYKVDAVESYALGAFPGVFDADGQRITLSREQAAMDRRHKALYASSVRIARVGDATLPVEILVHFSDGAKERRVWDGADRWARFEFTRPAKVDWVEIDPHAKLLLDVDFSNNSWQEQANRRLPVKWGGQLEFWMQNLVLWLSAFV